MMLLILKPCMKHHFITVEGNIGAGKTTLTHLLAKHFNAKLILEEFADNPFLPKFYENPAQSDEKLYLLKFEVSHDTF